MATAAAAPVPPAPSSAPLPVFEVVPWASIQASPLNPRKNFNRAKLEDLARSMAGGAGIIEPLIVRQVGKKAGAYELVAGERRWRAAEIAGLTDVPVMVKSLTDVQALELMVIENNQREDINALEEAQGFHALTTRGVNIDRIQSRIGRSRKYVYDRLKLLDLVPAAQQLLLADRINAGHAILLARLTKPQQERAIAVESDHRGRHCALFEHERTLPTELELESQEQTEKTDPYVGLKAKSVRELDAWISEHCRFEAKAPVNRELFPETARAVETAAKVVQITENTFTQPEVKEGNAARIYHGSSWKRADGSLVYAFGKKPTPSKTCAKSVLGVIVAGPGRGQAFAVCVNKDCDVHWKAERVAREKAATGGPAAAARYKEQQERDRKRREAEEAREKAARATWAKARPAIVEAFAVHLKTAAIGVVADIVAKRLRTGHLKGAAAQLGAAKSGEDWLRHLALSELMEIASSDWWGPRELPRYGKALGVDVAKALKKATVVQTSAPAATPAAKASVKTTATKKR